MDIKFYCNWNKDIECTNGMYCGGCEHQPADDDKKNGKEPPKVLIWQKTYGGVLEPVCPSCGEMPYSTERCVFCGQKLINERKPHVEYIGATLVEPVGDGFPEMRCDKCGEIIKDEETQMVSHVDGESFYAYIYRHKCGAELITKHYREK